MWPWEHLAVGYLAYSAYSRFRSGEPPDGPAAVAVAVATQLPDLIDKPLAWTFDVYPGGYSVGHSVFVAVAASILAGNLSRRFGHPAVGAAFAIGYLSHLPGDLLYQYATSGHFSPWIVLWPLYSPVVPPATEGLFTQVLGFLRRYGQSITSGEFVGFVLLELLLLGTALAVWVLDGLPGTVRLRRTIARTE